MRYMKEQDVFSVEWSGFIENEWKRTEVTASSIADAEHKAWQFISGVKHVRSITNTMKKILAFTEE